MSTKADIEKRIKTIEEAMNDPHFWDDKSKAQEMISEYQELKDELSGVGKYDKGNAVVTLYAGAGGLDAEDFTAMLFSMYRSFIQDKGWGYSVVSENSNDHGGYRTISLEVTGKNVYGTLKYESGVHRLVRISPFNSGGKRQTSFALVEVIPELKNPKDFEIPESEITIEFSKSGGPGGQNVNKRETAVRATHTPSGLSVYVTSERSQDQNRTKALEILRGRLYHIREEEQKKKEGGLSIAKTTANEWGSQIRSYVLHPYKLVKDHRTNTEIRDVEGVLEGGNITPFITAMKDAESEGV